MVKRNGPLPDNRQVDRARPASATQQESAVTIMAMATSTPSPASELVSIALIRHFLELTARQGQPTAPVLAAAGVAPELLGDDDGWLPVDRGAAMMHAVLRMSGDPQFYLSMSQLSFISGFGIVGYLLETSPTLKDAILSLMRYERLLSTVAFSRLEHSPGEVRWSVDCCTADPVVVRHMEEFHIGARYLFMRMVKERRSNIVSAVHFRHAAPPDAAQLAAYAAIFKCPVLFGQPASALILKSPALAFPLHQMAPGLKESLEAHADKKLLEMMAAANGSLLSQARAQLRSLLQRGQASRERLAECLGVSGRHLARQLQAEGSGYGELLDELRLDDARKLLRESARTIDEIGRGLNFSDGQTFSRWFRQRTGQAPSDFRQQQG